MDDILTMRARARELDLRNRVVAATMPTRRAGQCRGNLPNGHPCTSLLTVSDRGGECSQCRLDRRMGF